MSWSTYALFAMLAGVSCIGALTIHDAFADEPILCPPHAAPPAPPRDTGNWICAPHQELARYPDSFDLYVCVRPKEAK